MPERGESAHPVPARDAPVLEARDLRKYYPLRGGLFSRSVDQVRAVDGVSFSIARGETLGLVGESGCGKTTTGRLILRLLEPTGGSIRLAGQDITHLPERRLRPLRRHMQMVFQDPYLSLSPRRSVREIVGEPLENYGLARGVEKDDRVAALLERVGLGREDFNKRPHEFSGGQRQRLGIARAIALNPSLVVADEAVSALDVSVQAQVINLMVDLQAEFGLAYLFIAHDLAVVEHISHRVAVMYLGEIVELGDRAALFTSPQHPYTESLLDAVPSPSPTARRERILLEGDVPSPSIPPPGCRFHTRCPYAMEQCRVERPSLLEVRADHYAACHLRLPATPSPPQPREGSS